MNPTFSKLIGVGIVLLSVCVFFWFSYLHPEIVHSLKQTTGLTIVAIIAMYAGSIFALAFILAAMTWFFGKRLPISEYILLTAYSSLANFFGPGQSGPGVRAAYLKVKYGIDFKNFLFATLIYFSWLVSISGAMLIGPIFPWWLIIICMMVAASVGTLVIVRLAVQNRVAFVPLECKPRLMRMVLMTGIGTALQLAFITAAYFVELHAIDTTITLSQAISFTGAANFSLFVSITPGAIGIREVFLLFTQGVHGVSVETIATASALDRAAYLVVLALLGLLVLLTHAGQRFRKLD